MSILFYQVDAFTDRPFHGNPAAVCVLDEAADPDWMQALASEMNLSETAFLWREEDGFRLRWFTPAVEVDLCGHATLASAHTLWESGYLLPGETARFQTRSGLLTAAQVDGWIELDFPSTPSTPTEAPSALLDALGVVPIYVGKSRFDYLIEVETAADVRDLAPDFATLRSLDVRGVMVTSRGDTEEIDFVSRFFAPGSGIDEDPVTGSAHCCLAPHWASRLGKETFLAHQASARGGTLRIRLAGDRVHLAGQAVTIIRGRVADELILRSSF